MKAHLALLFTQLIESRIVISGYLKIDFWSIYVCKQSLE